MNAETRNLIFIILIMFAASAFGFVATTSSEGFISLQKLLDPSSMSAPL
jgi:hypothetical protein